MLEYLLEKGKSKISDAQYTRALIGAAFSGRNDVVKRLFKDVDRPIQAIEEALEVAAHFTRTATCKMILDRCKELKLDCDKFASIAAGWEEPQALQEFWKYTGSSVSHQLLDDSLYNAAAMGNEVTVHYLLEICCADPDGNSALLIAVKEDREDLMELLLQYGANCNALLNNGTTLLSLCTTVRSEKLVRLLLDAGADLNLTDCDGDSVIVLAVKLDRESLVKPLLDAGADPNWTDSDGNNALAIAAKLDKGHIV
ncbi:hypothetical protein CDD82_3131 [Ophiocordyceps australis]|uniref:Uncharacterized protein n=1 Tax=Ophiocordyceps australis TaxID=1399860 RepID=A0A2C5ZT80_9HYPO|nr:hypothetical protein CDD82_3131 [Ophiocordyceps australis]